MSNRAKRRAGAKAQTVAAPPADALPAKQEATSAQKLDILFKYAVEGAKPILMPALTNIYAELRNILEPTAAKPPKAEPKA